MNRTSDGDRVLVSRCEIESLCMIRAIPVDGCGVDELPGRLGLSPVLAQAVAEAIVPLVNAGRVQVQDDRVVVTVAGRAWLLKRLSEIGVGGRQSKP